MVVKALLNSLTEAEMALVREADKENLAELDEDELVEVHTRIRRARNKYVKLYRREASVRVGEFGGRGTARPKNRRNAEKSEVFEDALARVSRHLAMAARRSAEELKAGRLAAARRHQTIPPPRAAADMTSPMGSQLADRRPDSAALRRRQAKTLASGARRQAKRDSS
ncbi:hypothetical protein [Nonomuraea insulae]|uniref:Uncharacterized protein n=1 Tax=Nonomuraea insulae TaxID=1616787 RepID=A0ABW1DCT9_9ACTN